MRDGFEGPRASGSLEVRNLSRRFGALEVLRDVSLEATEGTLVGLVGPNGSGKTTLLRILGGLLEPDAGSVSVAGAPPGHGQTGYAAPGDRALYWRLTARQNLGFYAGLHGRRSWNLGWLVEALGADGLLDRRMARCSTGQRRRIAIALAFAGAAPVILIDEPFADLDDAGCRAVTTICRRWTDAGGVVVYAAPAEREGPEPDVRLAVEAGSVRASS